MKKFPLNANLELSPAGWFNLAPGDSMPGFVGYTFPDNVVPADTSTIHFTQVLPEGEVVGGLTIDFVVSDVTVLRTPTTGAGMLDGKKLPTQYTFRAVQF